MKHVINHLVGGRPIEPARVPFTATFLSLMTEDQPDTAERVRLQVQSIPFALPEKRADG